MVTQRPHTKSRTGCTNCKLRKVKCDETHPVCLNCGRRGFPCSFSNPNVGEPPSSSRSRSDRMPPHLTRLALGPSDSGDAAFPAHPVLHFSEPTKSDQIAPFPPHELRARDYELLHHYCTITADTLSIQQDMAHVWRVAIPREGYRYPFVMHGILSIAAAHKAYLMPSNRRTYLVLCDYHQAVGSEGFRSQLHHVKEDNWMPVFSFTSLVLLYTLTLPMRSEDRRLENPIASLLELIGLLRGINTTLAPIVPRGFMSELAPLAYGIWSVEKNRPPDGYPCLQNTLLPLDTWEAIRKLRAFQEAEIPSNSLVHYTKAVDDLEDSAKLVALAGVDAETGAGLACLYAIHESVLIDIQAHTPYAIVLVAYFSVFLATVETNFWYARGWARQLVDEVEAKLIGHPKCLKLIQWPREKLAETPECGLHHRHPFNRGSPQPIF